ncbi:MarR family winged helix-turn-helix transcriptional regulator [Porticoccus sp. GXU_MW_L64]
MQEHFERSLPMLLYRTLDAVMPAFREIFAQFGITEQQWRILRVLWEVEQCSMLELSRKTLIPAPSMVGIIDRLARDGLVQRVRSESDRRVVYIRVTTEGKGLEDQVTPLVDAAYEELHASVSQKDWQQMARTLDTIAASVDKTKKVDY